MNEKYLDQLLDDTWFIQRCIEFARGGLVYIPTGMYRAKHTLHLHLSAKRLLTGCGSER